MAKVLKARPRSCQEIERIAYDLIKSAQPDAVKFTISFDIESFFELELENRTGIEAVYDHLPEGIDGYTDSENMKCYVCSSLADYNDSQMTKRKLRSTIAHEVGHCFLHVEEARRNRDFQKKFLNDKDSCFERYRPEELKVYENPEWQAWRFASALLMPENCFRTAVERNFTMKKLKRAFDVNQAFVEVRLRELKITKCIKKG